MNRGFGDLKQILRNYKDFFFLRTIYVDHCFLILYPLPVSIFLSFLFICLLKDAVYTWNMLLIVILFYQGPKGTELIRSKCPLGRSMCTVTCQPMGLEHVEEVDGRWS